MSEPVTIDGWRGLGPAAEAALSESLSGWIGTPHRNGQRARSIAVDCVNLVAAVFDELYGSAVPTAVPRLPANTSLHDPETAEAVIRTLLTSWQGAEIVSGGPLEPGDVLVTRSLLRASAAAHDPGHAVLVDARPWWGVQSTNSAGVHRVQLSEAATILRVYRPRGKEAWRR